MRKWHAHSKNTVRLLLTSLVVILANAILPVVAHATIDWDEGFEYASNATMDTVWSSSCPGNDGIIRPTGTRPRTGSKSLELTFRGHQGITPGYQSCYKDRLLAAPTTGTLYTRFWMYMDNFTVDETTSKITLHPSYNGDAFTTMWWVMMFGSPNFSVSIQKNWTPPGTSDSVENIYGPNIPQNQWVCLETRLTYATPGQQNGVVQAWINGTQVTNRTNVWMDRAGQQSVFRGVRTYTQDGVGTIFYDDYAVSRDARIGCGGTTTQTDTTPPATPSGFTAR